MYKVILLVLLFISYNSHSKSIENISINQSESKSELSISFDDVNVNDIVIYKLSSPNRIYFDIVGAKKDDFLSFTRMFKEKNASIREMRVWFHDSIGVNKNVYRVAVEYNSNLIENYKVVKKDDMHIFFYPKNKNSFDQFQWTSSQIKKATYITKNITPGDSHNVVKDSIIDKVALISVDYQEFSELGNLKFVFNGNVPKYEYKILDKQKLVISFNSSYHLNNREVSRNFLIENQNVESVKFLGQDKNEQAMFVVEFNDFINLKNVLLEEEMNSIILSYSNKNSNNVNYTELNNFWNSIKEDNSINLVEKVYAKESISKNDFPKNIKIISDSAVFRKDAQPYSSKISSLKKDSRYTVKDFQNGYYKIKNNKEIGFVFKSYTDASIVNNDVKSSAKSNVADKLNKTAEKLDKNKVDNKNDKFSNPNDNIVSNNFYKTKVSNLNLRSTPSKNGKVIKMLNINEKVLLINRNGDWSKIELIEDKSKQGWVFSSMIKKDSSMQNIGKPSVLINSKKLSDTLTIIPEDEKISFKRNKELGPFIPRYKLSDADDSAPNLAFLSLVGIIYDKYDKIALFESRDKELSKTIFTMREGDKVKSGKLYKIEKDKVVFLITMFGITKTQILKIENKDK